MTLRNSITYLMIKRINPNLVNYNIISDKDDSVDIGDIEEICRFSAVLCRMCRMCAGRFTMSGTVAVPYI